MNVFEHAMKMEQDGREYYLEHAEKTSNPLLKKILLELADDELKHYHIFKAMRDETAAEYVQSEKTRILSTLRNVFETMKAENSDFEFPTNVREIWETAREVEKKSEDFYRSQADDLTDDHRKELFHLIADEEHRHWRTIESVIQFLAKPDQWLADAEWSDPED